MGVSQPIGKPPMDVHVNEDDETPTLYCSRICLWNGGADRDVLDPHPQEAARVAHPYPSKSPLPGS